MHGMQKTLNELHDLLKTAETNVKEEQPRDFLMVRKGKGFKKLGAKKYRKKPKKVEEPPKPEPGKKQKVGKNLAECTCYYCNVKGHFKNDCPKYKMDKKNKCVASTPGIFVIECNFAISSSCVLDTGCG